MSSMDDLTDIEREEIEKIRAGAAELVEQIARLQGGWNHGAKATRLIDGASDVLSGVDSLLTEP